VYNPVCDSSLAESVIVKPRLKVIGSNAAAAIFLVLLVEGLSRWVFPYSIPSPLLSPTGLMEDAVEPDLHLFWAVRPHLESEGVPLTNGLGFRGPEPGPKADDEFRILSLGESSTFARRLPDEQTYSRLLEQGLDRVDGKKVHVVNAGALSYTLHQGVELLRRRGLDLEPDAVLVYFGFDDFLPAARRVTAEGERGRALTDGVRAEQTRWLTHWLTQHSNLFRAASSRMARDTRVEVDRATVRVPEKDRLQLLIELREIALESNLRLVVVIPWYQTFRKHVALLRRLGAAGEIVLVDLPLELRHVPGRRASYFVDGIHPNADGHRVIAVALAERLREIWGDRE
jgi:lysophospholipase L1-like esterase